jgi:hypothetical protein
MAGAADPEVPKETLELEIEDAREDLGDTLSELDRRENEWLDWRRQLRKRAVGLGLGGASLVLAIAGAVAFANRRRQERNRPMAKARRFRDAVARMIEKPELVARPEPSIGRKALAAAAAGVSGTMAKFLARRLVARLEAAWS